MPSDQGTGVRVFRVSRPCAGSGGHFGHVCGESDGASFVSHEPGVGIAARAVRSVVPGEGAGAGAAVECGRLLRVRRHVCRENAANFHGHGGRKTAPHSRNRGRGGGDVGSRLSHAFERIGPAQRTILGVQTRGANFGGRGGWTWPSFPIVSPNGSKKGWRTKPRGIPSAACKIFLKRSGPALLTIWAMWTNGGGGPKPFGNTRWKTWTPIRSSSPSKWRPAAATSILRRMPRRRAGTSAA